MTRPRLGDELLAEADQGQQRLEAMATAQGGFRLVDVGEGSPVILVPTFGELNLMYVPLVEELSSRHRVLLHWPNLSTDAPFGPVERAAELQTVLDLAGVQAAHVVAWSDAGCVMTEFAADHPRRVRSLSYLGTPSEYVLPLGAQRLLPALLRLPLDRLVPDALAAIPLAYFLGGPTVPGRSIYGRISDIEQVAALFRYSILPCIVYSNRRRISQIDFRRFPALVMGGNRDRLVRESRQRDLGRLLQARYVHVEGGDHLLPLTAEEQVTTTVREFLGGIDQGD